MPEGGGGGGLCGPYPDCHSCPLSVPPVTFAGKTGPGGRRGMCPGVSVGY